MSGSRSRRGVVACYRNSVIDRDWGILCGFDCVSFVKNVDGGSSGLGTLGERVTVSDFSSSGTIEARSGESRGLGVWSEVNAE